MLKEHWKELSAILIDLVVFSLEIYCLTNFLGYLIKGNPDIRFRYYTNISNLFMGLISLADAIILIITLIQRKRHFCKVFSIIKFVGISMTTLTFVVILLAAPFEGFYKLYSGVKIITHLIVPLLAAFSYLFLSQDKKFEWRYSLLGVAPTIIYAIIYVLNVVILENWPDIYSVNKNGIWYVFVLIAIVLGFILTQGLYFLKKRMSKIY